MENRIIHELHMVPRLTAFRHVPNESLGYFESFLEEQDIPFEYVNLYETNEIPRLPGTTHLIFLGGPMSVNDEEEFPWLIQEKELIRRSEKARQNVLGICLGAQLIASAFGAPVFPSVRETGWCTLNRAQDAGRSFSRFPETFQVFQLHGETFQIPYAGRLLAFGTEVRNQAFSCRNALGLQFHLELTGPMISDWSKDLPRYQRERIIADTPRFLSGSNRLCHMVAEDFFR